MYRIWQSCQITGHDLGLFNTQFNPNGLGAVVVMLWVSLVRFENMYGSYNALYMHDMAVVCNWVATHDGIELQRCQ